MTHALPYWHVDAFADRPFAGNQAAVMPLEDWLDDAVMLAIAEENLFAETAFVVRDTTAEADWELRRVQESAAHGISPDVKTSHQLVLSGGVTWCIKCGAYSQWASHRIAMRCTPPRAKVLPSQFRLLLRGLHPVNG